VIAKVAVTPGSTDLRAAMSSRPSLGYTGMNSSQTHTPRAGRREWVALAVIALPCLLYSMDLGVLYLALPSLSAALKPSPTQLLWISDIYGFLLAGFLLTMGILGDRIGRRRLLLIGAAMFGLASVLAAFATSVAMLIVARGLLGIAASTLAPSTLSLIRNMFLDDRQRTAAIGVWVMSFSAGAALGPALGGLLLHFFWWGSVFLIAVPVMALLLVLGPMLLPEFREPDPRPLDLPSAALSLFAVLALVYGIKQLAQSGFGPVAAVSFLIGAGLGLVFLRRQQTLAAPLLDLHLFRRPVFAAALAANTLSLFLIFGTFFVTDQYLQLVLGLSPLVAGLWSVLPTFGFIGGSSLGPVLSRRVGVRLTMTYGFGIAAGGLTILTQLPAHGGHGLPLTLIGTGLLALGVSPVVTLATDVIIGAVAPENAGQASGLSETATELGGALGIALLGSIAAAVYRSHSHLPVGVGQVRTLAGAVHAAAHLPEPLRAALLDASRLAFTQGLHVVAIVGAVLAALLAVVVARVLRGVGAEADALAPAVIVLTCDEGCA
jgi:DHA2 family multidrug resistance protein-like MFS transporter